MDTQNKRKIIMIVGLALVVFAILTQINVLVSYKGVFYNSIILEATIINIVALLSAGFYIATGFKKTSAKFYLIFVYLFLVAQLITIIDLSLAITRFISIELIIFTVIVFGLVNVLAFAKDLGKLKSLILAYIVVGLTVLALLTNFIKPLILGDNNEIAIRLCILRWIGMLTLSVVLLGSVYLKYYDKSLRNTK